MLHSSEIKGSRATLDNSGCCRHVTRLSRWLRFVLGLILLALFAGFFISGYSPPGVLGEVLRHNQANQIDASPLFYSEVEHMAQLEESCRILFFGTESEEEYGNETD